MSPSAVLVAGCAVVTALLKAAGPIALGGREIPLWVTSVIVLLAPALLAALVFTQAFADGSELAVGAETAGVVAGGLVAWRTGSIVACVIGAKRSPAPSHKTSPRQHSALPTKSAGKRYMTNHGIASFQRCPNARERRSREARSRSLTSEFQL